MNFTEQIPIHDGLYWVLVDEEDVTVVEVSNRRIWCIGNDIEMTEEAKKEHWQFSARLDLPTPDGQRWAVPRWRIWGAIPKRLIWLTLFYPFLFFDLPMWIATGKKFYLSDKLSKWSEKL